MSIPKVNVQFIDTIQPDIPAWINTTTSFAEGIARQIDLVTYKNDLFLTKQLFKRIHKEVFRISGEVIRENFKQTLTQNWFWTSHEELIKLLKRYKTIPDNTVTQASLLQNVQNIPFRGEQ
jgi:hypothetical protein